MKRKIPNGGILTVLVLTIISCTLSAQTYIGIDVSHHQGKIQWEEVAKEKIDFVYIKAICVVQSPIGTKPLSVISAPAMALPSIAAPIRW